MMQLLAQIDPELQIFQEAFRGGSSLRGFGSPAIWGWSIVIVGMLLTVVIGWSMIQRDHALFGPTNRSLYAAIRLNTPQRKLMNKLAACAGLTMPASLLISRGSYERAVKVFAGRYGATPLLAEIRLKAFGRTSFQSPENTAFY